MVICAMLTALSVLFTRISPQLGNAFRFSFGTIPIMLSGLLFGGMYGFLVGIAADLIGSLINLMGSTFIIGITICSGLLGVVPTMMYDHILKKKNLTTLAISIFSAELAVSAVLKSLCLMQVYGGAFTVWFFPKLLNAVIMATAEFIIITLLLKVLGKTNIIPKTHI